jgi:hypothetical protein
MKVVTMYMIPIFLWSVVVNHDVQPLFLGRTLRATICGTATDWAVVWGVAMCKR